MKTLVIDSTPHVSISEILTSFEGEGVLAGQQVLFVRMAGCSVKCPWCDTKYSWNANISQLYTLDDAVEVVMNHYWTHPVEIIEITGGEPLDQPHLAQFVQLLLQQNFSSEHLIPAIVIRTSGMVPAIDFVKAVGNNVEFIIDIKVALAQSVDDERIMQLVQQISAANLAACRNVIEFHAVCSELRHLIFLRYHIVRYIDRGLFPNAVFTITPVWGSSEQFIKQLAFEALNADVEHYRFSLQQHKYIWGADSREEGIQ